MTGVFRPDMRRAEALDVLANALREAGFEDFRFMARLLLADILGTEPGEIVLNPDREIGEAAERLGPALVRACAGEPLTRIAGRRSFYGRDFLVTPDVLDPRPETELLVEEMLKRLAGQSAPRLLDLGTGSGAIFLTLLAELPRRGGGGGYLPAALWWRARTRALGGWAGDFPEGDLFAGLTGPFDAILSNPPYIPAPISRGWKPPCAILIPLWRSMAGRTAFSSIGASRARRAAFFGRAVGWAWKSAQGKRTMSVLSSPRPVLWTFSCGPISRAIPVTFFAGDETKVHFRPCLQHSALAAKENNGDARVRVVRGLDPT